MTSVECEIKPFIGTMDGTAKICFLVDDPELEERLSCVDGITIDTLLSDEADWVAEAHGAHDGLIDNFENGRSFALSLIRLEATIARIRQRFSQELTEAVTRQGADA